ncbi:MAG: cyclic nucleotide-binding domain-containing protein [Methylococcaceae bacterium]|nr:cyclic nucleotide-binding domain-containing protein [Methylococcaceae bacterium]
MSFSFDSPFFVALSYGIVSACSLPLGCLTTLFWTPSDRALAFLMAFGGGALLAALTIDLVASTLNKGDFYPLAAGCILGGLIFIVLNQIVNNFGGFVRKASTHVHHIQKLKQHRFKGIFTALKRIDVFQQLKKEDYKILTEEMYYWDVKKDTLIFSQGEPCDELYIIAAGQVELLDPEEQVLSLFLEKNDDLGWLAFISGTPYRFTAKAIEDTSLWVLPRTTFFNLLTTSPKLVEAIQHWLKSDKVNQYLQYHHHLSDTQMNDWRQLSSQQITQHGFYQSAVQVKKNKLRFKKIAQNIDGVDLFNDLPEKEIEAISDRLVYKKYKKGNTFFHEGEGAEHLFIIDGGNVSIIDGYNHFKQSINLTANSVFGQNAFMTGGRYTMSAVALDGTAVWVLRKKDFNYLIVVLPELAKRYKSYLQQQEIYLYLIDRQKITEDNAKLWVRKAIKHLSLGTEIKPVMDYQIGIHDHKGAPLGIWLGLMLDGIPEALVIGASLIHSHLGYSLLAGLFLSNYPEALSSSVGMRKQGMKFSIILFMWISLMLLTGILSVLGNIYFAGVSHQLFSFTEGLAAGSMLTMIAQTMLPEAYFKGGEIIGFSTLLGFLSAIFFKTLE